jgi:hypothetical protein
MEAGADLYSPVGKDIWERPSRVLVNTLCQEAEGVTVGARSHYKGETRTDLVRANRADRRENTHPHDDDQASVPCLRRRILLSLPSGIWLY